MPTIRWFRIKLFGAPAVAPPDAVPTASDPWDREIDQALDRSIAKLNDNQPKK